MGEIRNSITSGMGNMAGFIGEQVANEVIKGIINNTYDYDIIEDNILWDVKTKRCTSRPRPHYECSIAALNHIKYAQNMHLLDWNSVMTHGIKLTS